MEEPRPQKDPAQSMAELAAALNDMRDALVNMSLMMKDHLFELEAKHADQGLAKYQPPETDKHDPP